MKHEFTYVNHRAMFEIAGGVHLKAFVLLGDLCDYIDAGNVITTGDDETPATIDDIYAISGYKTKKSFVNNFQSLLDKGAITKMDDGRFVMSDKIAFVPQVKN